MPRARKVAEQRLSVSLHVNGLHHQLIVAPRRTLLQVLREDLHLTGTKEGCGLGTCGACTVLLDGKAVCACLMLAVQASGWVVETIESLGNDGSLDPIQELFIRHDAFQCGFCTPGQIMTLKGLLRQNAQPSDEEIRAALSGNVCRCGAYPRIEAAALAAARRPADDNGIR
jgi:aerobic-type carbon monoxide dehydrogenase small subunit (CoxS/CutS family)